MASIFNATTRPGTSNSSESHRGGTVSGNSFRAIIQMTPDRTICNSFTGRLAPSQRGSSECAICQAWLRDWRSGGTTDPEQSKGGPFVGKRRTSKIVSLVPIWVAVRTESSGHDTRRYSTYYRLPWTSKSGEMEITFPPIDCYARPFRDLGEIISILGGRCLRRKSSCVRSTVGFRGHHFP